jgi:superfamily II DNA or RNA helicase
MEYIERYYQREARDAIDSGFFEFNSGVLHLGTGAGKTSIIAKDIENTRSRCLFLADQEELLMQPVKAFKRVGDVTASIEQAKLRAPLSARVVVGSSQTFSRKNRITRYPRDHFQRIYVDECHRGSDRDQEICNYFENAQRVGMTATPFRAKLADLSSYYDTVFYSKPMLDLVAEGFAPPMSIFHLPVEVDLESVGFKRIGGNKDYNPEDVDSTITPRLEAIATVFAQYAQRRHTIAYLPLIKTSMAFAAALRNAGLRARHIDGSSHDREQLLEAFARGDIDVLTNAGVISTGVDLPIADCFLNLRPLRSMNEYQQSAGRTLRALPGLIDHLPEKDQAAERRELIEWSEKPNALMFDLLWQHDRLGVMTPAHLIATSEDEADEMNEAAKKNLSPEDLIALQLRVQAEREAKLVRALQKAAEQADTRRPSTAEEITTLTGSPRLRNYRPQVKWEHDDVTDPQINSLQRWGVDPSTVANKGHANKILDELGFRYRAGFCSISQLKRLTRLNNQRDPEARVNKPWNLTYVEAKAILDTNSMQQHAERLRAA